MKQLLVLAMLLLLSNPSYADKDLYLKAGGYGCAACHGKYAHGGNNVGGNIRGADLAKLNDALANEPTMQLLGPTLDEQQRASLVQYLAELDQYQLIEWQLKDGSNTVTATFTQDRPLQLVIFNSTLQAVSLDLTPIGQSASLTITPYDTQSVELQANQPSYTLTINQQKLVLKKQ
ncbi:c-type cytochrome [Motilimonas eburnea]|uniref:c-type cytochrome n=1 Tax=Motilimonas eburnea TaxID=1737488 RepID=UPI001E45CCF9|nr:cytochrome c [Motilimonas eburnea]MCE2571315.1 cytochrome c [Motilimonas eburnea]